MILNINTPRGCGTLKPGGFYLRGLYSATGTLHPLTWVLGDGINGDGHPFVQVPPLKVMEIDPAASLYFGELRKMKPAGMTGDDLDEYNVLVRKTRIAGIADHVGEQFYTAYAFVKELRDMGASRRVAPDFAYLVNRLVRKHGAVPILFTHPRIPVFGSKGNVEEALKLSLEYFPEFFSDDVDLWWHRAWLHPDWGMHVRNRWQGWGHVMIPILALVDAAWKAKKGSRYYEARRTIQSWRYQESWVCATWINRVAYVLPESRVVPKEVSEAKLAIIDLEKEI